MEQVHFGLIGAGAQVAAGASYVQTVMFYSCAVNNTHVNEMFDKLKNLRVVALLDSPAIVPPLRIPAAAMTRESQLIALRLEGMGLGEIPPEFGRLSESLSILTINRNRRLQKVPRELGQCTNLGLLYLRDNAITLIPSELGRLTGLATLALAGNKLASLPAELGSLVNMQAMYLGRNRITELPPSFGEIRGLTLLSVGANLLTTVPILDAQPQAWPKLRIADFEGNRILTWPKSWILQNKVQVAQLPFNTTTGDDGDGLYETYVARRRTVTRIGQNSSSIEAGKETDGTLAGREVALVLMSGNPVVNNSSTAAQLWEFSREGDTVGNVGGEGEPIVMLVSSKGNCALGGCWSVPWKGYMDHDPRGDSYCDTGCNVSTCNFDGGDCSRVIDM
jgi:hypothetical protein